MKSGWKTTEFWGKLIVQIFSIFGALKGAIDPEVAGLITGGVEGAYGIARSIVKFKGGSLPSLPK